MKATSHQIINVGRICTTIGVLALTGLLGCTVETGVALIPEEQGTVDPSFIGDWRGENPMFNPTYRLQVRDLDGKRYILGLMAEGGQDPVLYSAVLVNIAGSTFAQIRTLDLNSTPEYRYGRVALYGNNLFSFRELDQNFFSGPRQFTSPTELMDILATNIDNPEMYSEEAWIGTRIERQ
jgi:hypothetical protein